MQIQAPDDGKGQAMILQLNIKGEMLFSHKEIYFGAHGYTNVFPLPYFIQYLTCICMSLLKETQCLIK